MKMQPTLYYIVDQNLVCRRRTNAILQIGSLIEGAPLITFDQPWEGDHCVYHNFFKDGDIYRMYYLAHASNRPFTEIKVCYMESQDGFHWVRPHLGLREFNGNKDNNIILDQSDQPHEGDFFDNFFVFKDRNPHSKKDELYKALAYKNPYRLECFFSADGINFRRGYPIEVEGHFDTLNVCFYDEDLEKYVAFIRGFHNIIDPMDLNQATRDIRRIESKDFRTWKETGLLDFGPSEDIPLYTNQVMKRAKNTYIGFPTRYIERHEWNDNYEKLLGKEARLARMNAHPRYGLALTDCLFMLSQDTKKWQRFDEALITPGIEDGTNWVYGDGYPAYGLIKRGPYVHFFLRKHQWSSSPAVLYDYYIRRDGFAYYYAPYQEKKIVLKPRKLSTDHIFINFATSAAGYVRLEISNGRKTISSLAMFGDSLHREVSIDSKELTGFLEQKVTITIYLKDAKIYTIAL